MGKWKCTNCGNIFESEDGCEKDEFDIHCESCFDLNDFFKLLNN